MLEAGLFLLYFVLGDGGAELLASVLKTNTTMEDMKRGDNQIGPVGARALAAALDNNATLASLTLQSINDAQEAVVVRPRHGQGRQPCVHS